VALLMVALSAHAGAADLEAMPLRYAPVMIPGSVNRTRSGDVAGGGAEWMFYPAWSAALEYNYLDFRSSFVPLGIVERPSIPTFRPSRSAWIGIRAGFDREMV
jgi:hypothetical protein